ncbi:MAG: hypothetical protein ACFBSD_15010 [Paracoccaceae bacterium]
MRTTINDMVGRRGDTCTHETVDQTLDRARRIFADVAAFLELEIDRLFQSDVDPIDEARVDKVRDLIRQNQQALLKVLEIQQKLGRDTDAERRQMLDLEAARDEIARRLDRLAA